MLSIRNVSILRTTYLFILKLCAKIVYGKEAVERTHGDTVLNSSEVSRIRRINSELEIGPKEWETQIDERIARSKGPSAKFHTIEEVGSCMCDAGEALAGDTWTSALTSAPPEPWNFMLRTAGQGGIPWMFLPLWLVGVWIRYCILLPLRIGILFWGAFTFCVFFAVVSLCLPKSRLKTYLRQRAICFFSSAWVASFGGIIRYHGKKPTKRANQIYVANHTSLIDAYLLLKDYPFSFIGQRHKGLAGALEDLMLSVQSHVWFDRSEGRDRKVVQGLLKSHVENENEPMIVFPEGTCVNNEYCIMFKKGCFELGATVYPIAIKYNKQFSDPYWVSSQTSFARHLFDLMTSWAVVADVYYLEPQDIGPDETSTQFAARVKKMICERADLIAVNWDGFLKRNRLSPKFMVQRQKSLAELLIRRLSPMTKSASMNNLVLSDNRRKSGVDMGKIQTPQRESPLANGMTLRKRTYGPTKEPAENGHSHANYPSVANGR